MHDIPGTPITDAARKTMREVYFTLGGPLGSGAYVSALVAERLELDRAYLMQACEKLLRTLPDTPHKAEALAALAAMQSVDGAPRPSEGAPHDDIPHTADNPAHGLGGD